jgi:hypothetical protein
MWVAIWNGYPTFYPDSSTYIGSGFQLDTPVDRPITYGLFIWLASAGGLSLWPTLFFQTLLLVLALREFTALFISKGHYLVLLITNVITGVSFLSSQVMTDLFTSIMLLSMLLFMFAGHRNNWWLGVFVVCCAMHTSHLLLAAACLPFLATARWMSGASTLAKALKRCLPLAVAIGVAYIPINISVVKSGEAFYAAHLADTGDLQEYLERSCDEHRYIICDMGPIEQNAEIFLWHPDGIAQHYPSRDAMKKELGSIISSMVHDPISSRRIVRSTMKYWYQQLSHYTIGEGNVPFDNDSDLDNRVRTYFDEEHHCFERMQQNDPFVFDALTGYLNVKYKAVILISVMILTLACMVLAALGDRLFIACTFFLFMGYLLNCLVNAGLVVVANRFGAKLIWLLPLLAIIGAVMLVRRLSTRKQAELSDTSARPANFAR